MEEIAHRMTNLCQICGMDDLLSSDVSEAAQKVMQNNEGCSLLQKI